MDGCVPGQATIVEELTLVIHYTRALSRSEGVGWGGGVRVGGGGREKRAWLPLCR